MIHQVIHQAADNRANRRYCHSAPILQPHPSVPQPEAPNHPEDFLSDQAGGWRVSAWEDEDVPLTTGVTTKWGVSPISPKAKGLRIPGTFTSTKS